MNKIILITGASSDMGIALIKKIIDKYSVIVAHYCHWNDKLEELKSTNGDKIKFIQADLNDVYSTEALINIIKKEKVEPDHIVHFPSPKVAVKKFEKISIEEFDSGWDVSLRSLVVILQAFLPYMRKQKYGKVLLMLSSLTLDMPPKFESAYVTVKYAMLGLMRSLAAEYADKGITFNGISPDMVQTKFLSDLPGLMIEQYAETRSRKRILRVEDVVPTLDFMLSEGADCINGENIGIG